MLIGVVGLICSGKTSFIKKTEKFFPEIIAYKEPCAAEHKLSQFYGNKKKYALSFQYHMLHRRCELYKNAIYNSYKEGKTCIFDTCPQFDLVYAYLNHKFEKNIDGKEYSDYIKEYKKEIVKYPKLDRIIVLDCKPQTSRKRIVLRANKESSRKSEVEGCPLSYLVNQKQALDFFVKIISKENKDLVKTWDWNNFERNVDSKTELSLYKKMLFS